MCERKKIFVIFLFFDFNCYIEMYVYLFSKLMKWEEIKIWEY